MICLLAHPYLLFSLSKFSLFLSLSVCMSLVELTDGRGKEVVWKEPNQTTTRKPGALKIIQYSMITILDHLNSNYLYNDAYCDTVRQMWKHIPEFQRDVSQSCVCSMSILNTAVR